MKRALTIAGFDPSGWAGVIADLTAFSALGVDGVSAVTALTAQTRAQCRAVQPVHPAFVAKQVSALTCELHIDAVKIGMLATGKNVRAIAGLIKASGLKNVVLDTVFRATSGRALLDREGAANIGLLLRLATVATPNLAEASILLKREVKSVYDMEDAARDIALLGPANVVITGGHLKGAPVDLLFDGKKLYWLEGKRIKAGKAALHGTGCLFSSALTAGLAKGRGVKTAALDAKRYVEATLKKRASKAQA